MRAGNVAGALFDGACGTLDDGAVGQPERRGRLRNAPARQNANDGETLMPGIWPGTERPDRATSDVASLDLFHQRFDLVRDPLEPGVDVERLAIGVEGALVVADVLHDEAKPGQRPEMARLAG